jgi:hypothetical protein
MTDETMALRGLLEKSADASFLREMIGFAAERLMELEVGELTGAVHGERSPDRLVSATATGTATGRPGPGRSSCGSRSFGGAPTSQPFSSPGGLPRRH